MTDPVSDELAKIFMRTGDLQNPPRLAVIGDSHALFFAGVEKMAEDHAVVPHPHAGIRVYYLGAGLVSSLVKPQSRNHTREKVLMALDDLRPLGVKQVLFCFGEIDCRYHIRERCLRLKNDVPEQWLISAQVTALRYMSFLLEVKLLGFAPALMGPPPSTPNPPDLHQWLTYGTTQERNWLTKSFTALLQSEAALHRLPFISLFDALVDDKLNTRGDFSTDGVHISQKFWPLFEERAGMAGLTLK